MKVLGLLVDVTSNPGKVIPVEVDEEKLDSFYSILNCSTIDITFRKIGDRTFNIVCDDNGLLRPSPIISAVSASGKPMFVGNVFICNHYKEHLTSLSEDDIDYIAFHVLISLVTDPKNRSRHKIYPIISDVDFVT